MKIVTFCGIQNSGKTTLIREIINRLTNRGQRSAIIVNERGEAGYDEDFASANGVHMEYLRGG
jgi:molybdopterin-guanine dinucleotide biosynthesis protein